MSSYHGCKHCEKNSDLPQNHEQLTNKSVHRWKSRTRIEEPVNGGEVTFRRKTGYGRESGFLCQRNRNAFYPFRSRNVFIPGWCPNLLDNDDWPLEFRCLSKIYPKAGGAIHSQLKQTNVRIRKLFHNSELCANVFEF